MATTDKDEEIKSLVTGVTCLGAIILLPFIIVISNLLTGWVLSILWAWFVVPVFHLPALSIPAAIGVSLVMGFLTKQSDTIKQEYQDTGRIWSSIVTVPLITLAVGWAVHVIAK